MGVQIPVRIGYFGFFGYFGIEPVQIFLYFGSGLGILSLGSVISGPIRIFRF